MNADDDAVMQDWLWLAFGRSWAAWRKADTVVLARGGVTIRIVVEPAVRPYILSTVKRVSGGMLRV